MSKQTFTTAYNRNEKSIRDINTVKFTAPSKVKASLAYSVDLNNIYRDYCKSGKLPLNGQTPIYDENFVKYDSLIEAQKLVDDACKYFNGLPATIKNQYSNDLGKFVKALNNKDEFLIKEGLLQLPVQEEKEQSVVVAPEAPEVNTAPTD